MAKTTRVQVQGAEVAQGYDALNVKDNLTATESNGVVTIKPTGLRETVQVLSNGTTAVSVFGASGLPFAITITGVYLISNDTTATNITVENPASTIVCTIAKGTAAGALVGAVTLANTAVPAGNNVIVDGSGAGVAQVFITYTRA